MASLRADATVLHVFRVTLAFLRAPGTRVGTGVEERAGRNHSSVRDPAQRGARRRTDVCANLVQADARRELRHLLFTEQASAQAEHVWAHSKHASMHSASASMLIGASAGDVRIRVLEPTVSFHASPTTQLLCRPICYCGLRPGNRNKGEGEGE